ncbi:peroxidase family protein [Arthrobacter globiformis]|nr:peroxidase family protein [Arthrobacter globiformis]
MMPIAMGLPVVAANAVQAPVGEGFTITPSDLSFILKQIKIAEAHVANTTSATGPCGALIGTGPNQIPSPLVSAGLRTVDGSCNNLQPGQETFGAADQKFPRLTTPVFNDADAVPAGFGPPGPSSYKQKKGNVFDSEPRVISNLIVDQTSTNPAARAAAGFPVRTQGNTGVEPCTTDPVGATPGVPADCVPSHSTLFIENVTTDVGLSPPYNSMFTLFGQFFDHGVDQTVKSGGTVYVPLKGDDPLIAGPDHVFGNADDLDPHMRFMVLTRGQNQPGPDGILGDKPDTPADESADDIQDANNTDSPWVDQSQTYTSHASHQVFVREYVENAEGKPVSTGKLLGGPTGPTAGGMATWATTKEQAATKLGLRLEDKDVLNVPMIAADPYGKFIPGPNGLPQYVTATGLVEGHLDDPLTTTVDETVPVPANVKYFDTPFLTDIAHNADPSPQDTDHNPATAKVTPAPDADNTASADFASQAPGTYDDEMLDAHFIAGDGRVNENIGLTAIHQIFHSEHDRLVDDIEHVLTTDTSASGVKALAEWKLATGAGSANGGDGWNGERLFQAARFITEMEYQHLVFEEFARKVQPAINPFEPFAFTQTELNPAVKAEFAHAVYRFGHSMLTETISRRNEDGPGLNGTFGDSDDTKGSPNDISLLDGFLNPPEYTDGGPAGALTSEEAAGSIIMGMSDQAGNELDEFVTDTLRNNLLGLPLDLPTINMTRARSEGIPRLNVLRRELFNKTNDGQLKPYINWVDFGENLKHPESLVNFVAAYGQHPTILKDAGADGLLDTADDGPATLESRRAAARAIVNPELGDVPPTDAAAFMNSTDAWANDGANSKTGLDNVDLWVGGLAEQTVVFGGLLGSTFNYVFENQLTDLQNGDRLYYLARTPGMNLRAQLEGNSFAEMMMRNTNVHTLKADAFATSDCKFELKKLAGTTAGFAASGNAVADDPDSECSEADLLIRMPDGTIKYRARNSVDPSGINGQSVYNGTAGVDRIFGGNDSDTFWGGEGNDVIEGGDGADVALGGEGDDIITDLAGDDVPKGGPGNDAIDAGPGLDIVMGGDGKDFTNGGANANETFAGAGDDFVMLGQSLDAAFGDSGDDWEEGGDQPDLMQGDSGNLFFLDDSQKPGHDILIGQGGDDDYDMEGGDDIGLGGPGIEKVAGASGYDWEIGLGDPQPQNLDLDLPLVPLDILTVDVRDKFNEVEAASGWKFDDKIRGDDVVPSAVGGGGFIGCNVLDQEGLNRITGLDALVPDLDTSADAVIAASASKDCPLLTPGSLVWGAGNVLLGGGGSDEIEGRGGDDVIDGDAYLSVRLSVRTNPNDPATEIGSAAADGAGQSAMTSRYLKDANGNLTGPTLQEAVFAGTVNPGNIVAVREILSASGGTDTAVFSDIRANYTITEEANGVTTVSHNNAGPDGTDTLRNIETLRFSDSVAPAAPLIGVASAGNGQATVNFTPGAGGLATSFSVRVLDVTTNAAGVQVGALRTAPAGATSLVVTGLENGRKFKFEVSATNDIGTSPFSAPSNVVTTVAPVVAGAPVIGTATAGTAEATVRWTAPAAVTNATAVTQYRVRVFVGAAATPAREVTVGNVTSTVITGLINGTGYTFDVSAINSAGTGAPSARSGLVTPRSEFVAPTITARTPAPAARSVSQTGNLTATFSEAVANVGNSTFAVRLGTNNTTGTPLAAAVTYNGTTRTATLNPSATLLPDRTYTAAISNIRDAAGNTVAPTTWTFTTGPAPTLTSIFRGAGATGQARNGNLTAFFSENITGYNSTTVRLTRVSNGAVFPATMIFNPNNRGLTINPSGTLLANTQYRVTVTGGTSAVRDLAGNPFVTRSWTFTTGTGL